MNPWCVQSNKYGGFNPSICTLFTFKPRINVTGNASAHLRGVKNHLSLIGFFCISNGFISFFIFFSLFLHFDCSIFSTNSIYVFLLNFLFYPLSFIYLNLPKIGRSCHGRSCFPKHHAILLYELGFLPSMKYLLLRNTILSYAVFMSEDHSIIFLAQYILI